MNGVNHFILSSNDDSNNGVNRVHRRGGHIFRVVEYQICLCYTALNSILLATRHAACRASVAVTRTLCSSVESRS